MNEPMITLREGPDGPYRAFAGTTDGKDDAQADPGVRRGKRASLLAGIAAVRRLLPAS